MPKIIKTKTINSIIVEYLEYCNYKNLRLKTIKPVGFAISAINEGWELNKKSITTGINSRSFSNFESRDYDYGKLESMLLGHEEYSDNDIYKVLNLNREHNYTSNNSKRFRA